MGACNLLWSLTIKGIFHSNNGCCVCFMWSWFYSLTKAPFVSVLNSGMYGRVLEHNHDREICYIFRPETNVYHSATYNARCDETFKSAWELHIPAAGRIYSSKEVGKLLSFCSIFLLIYLYSDWQVRVLRCVVRFSLLYSDWQVCVLRCVVGFSVS